MVRMDGSYPEFLTDILDFGPNCSTFEFGPHTFEPPRPPLGLWAFFLYPQLDKLVVYELQSVQSKQSQKPFLHERNKSYMKEKGTRRIKTILSTLQK